MSLHRKSPGGRKRASANQHVTKNGNVFKIHRNLTERWVAKRDATERRKAERKVGLPKGRVKRFFYHFKPSRMYHYWFSRDGGVMALKIVGLGLVVGFVFLLAVFAYFRKDLPNLTASGDIGGSIRYYDRTGKTLLWEDYDAVKRIPVKTKEQTNFVRQATVAVEDKDFFKHGGFDLTGILRAGINDTLGHGGTQGGSTITQQLVKLSQNWTNQRTFTRKIKEVILAVELERSYSKDDILTGYLNTAPYGNIEYGVEAASRDYFRKSAKELTLDESAFLAAIPKSPSLYSPYGYLYKEDPTTAKKELEGRQHYILDLMVQQGYISSTQADAAKKVNTLKKVHQQETKYAAIKAPYFVLAAKSQLEAERTQSVNRTGWKVITTVDLKLQDLAEKSVQNNMANVRAHGGDQAAFVAEDVKTGQIVALVGGSDFTNKEYGKINYAHNAFIAPGSSFKPYDYSAVIEDSTNAGAGSVLYDRTGPLPGYPCSAGARTCLTDFDKRSPGPITLRYALGGSRNIPAVKANLIVGTKKVNELATDMMYNVSDQQNNRLSYNCYSDVQLTKTNECGGSAAIGDGAFLHLDDHVNGLATLARLGKAIPRSYILKILDTADKEVKPITYESKQVLRPDTAYILNDMASDPRASYMGYGAFHRYKGWNFAIKTGTTNDAFDGLMTSWSTQYAAVSWVGYHTRTRALVPPMENITMPIIRPWMQQAHDMLHKNAENWQRPSGVKNLPAFVVRSHVGYGSIEPSPATDLFPSWYKPNSKQASNKPIDIVSNKLATDCTPNLARKNASNSNANAFSIDIFVAGGAASNTNQTDDVHKCDDERPSISINPSTPGSCSGTCTVYVDVQKGTHPLSGGKYKGTVNLMVDGKIVKSVTVNNSGTVPVSFSYSGNGNKTVKAQIIDSVLYDSTSGSVNINFSGGGGGGGPSILSPSDGEDKGGSVTVIWTGGSGPFDVFVNGSNKCPNTNLHSCSFSGLGSGNRTIRVEDDNGESDEITIH